MSKNLLKLLIWFVLGVVVVIALAGAATGAANLIAYFQRGADPASALNIVPNVPPDLHVKVTWQPDDADTGRALEPLARSQIEAVYLRAWLQWNLSYVKNEPYGLKTYFTGPALDTLMQSITDAAARKMSVTQSNTSHQLRLHSYSADGAFVSFTDEHAVVMNVIRDSRGRITHTSETLSRYDIVMFLEDGNWRIRHMTRTKGETDNAPLASPIQNAGFVSARDDQLILNDRPFISAGTTYYPRDTAWDKFWPKYDGKVIEADFTRMQKMGLNTVRIFVQYEIFGGPAPEPAMMEKLNDLLKRAAKHNLKVIVTLFDLRSDYSPILWPQSDRHLEKLLTEFKNRPEILAWDIKNEPDRDFSANGREVVNAWVAHTARMARQYAPNHLITVGWWHMQPALDTANDVHVLSFHHFAPVNELPALIKMMQTGGDGKPIMLQEFGLPTYNTIFPNGHTEQEQAEYYADVLQHVRDAKLAGYTAWTQNDFTYVMKGVGGQWPWQSQPEAQMGVVRTDGTFKPAAPLLTPGASLDVPRAPFFARFIKPFWLILYAIGAALVIVFVVVARRRRKDEYVFVD